MPQYFIDIEIAVGSVAKITGDDFHHLLHVRRVKSGDSVYVRDSKGLLYTGWVACIGGDSIDVEISAIAKNQSGLPRITLAVSLIKHGNFELVIQKATEIGIAKIIPLMTTRTVVDMSKKDKHDRWQRILEEAAKQSMRADIPEIAPVIRFAEFVKSADSQIKIITHPREDGISLREAVSAGSDDAIIAVGPEGGFSPEEIELACAAGFVCVNFGETQLRAETAAIVLPALLLYELDMRRKNAISG